MNQKKMFKANKETWLLLAREKQKNENLLENRNKQKYLHLTYATTPKQKKIDN